MPLACKVNWPLAIVTASVGSVNGFTVTEKFCVALKLGVPLSATCKVNKLVVLASVTCGRHENAPVLVFNVALPGPL